MDGLLELGQTLVTECAHTHTNVYDVCVKYAEMHTHCLVLCMRCCNAIRQHCANFIVFQLQQTQYKVSTQHTNNAAKKK